MNFDNLILELKKSFNEARFTSLTNDRTVSSCYVGNRTYIVRKFVGKLPVFCFIVGESDYLAQDEVVYLFEKAFEKKRDKQ